MDLSTLSINFTLQIYYLDISLSSASFQVILGRLCYDTSQSPSIEYLTEISGEYDLTFSPPIQMYVTAGQDCNNSSSSSSSSTTAGQDRSEPSSSSPPYPLLARIAVILPPPYPLLTRTAVNLPALSPPYPLLARKTAVILSPLPPSYPLLARIAVILPPLLLLTHCWPGSQ